jgi:hypothetical protein
MLLDYIGTETGGIGLRQKMGTSTLGFVSFKGGGVIRIREESNYLKDDKHYYVVLIRDVLDKWKSGYREELKASDPWKRAGAGRLFHFNVFEKGFLNRDPNTIKIVNLLKDMHDSNGIFGIDWMYSRYHSCFWLWNNGNKANIEGSFNELNTFSKLPNVYFLELKDLSNPKFLKWLQNKDDGWNRVSEIPHLHKTPKPFKSQIELFWEQYKQGKILVGEQLFSPLIIEHLGTGWIEDMMYHYNTPGLEWVKWQLKTQQEVIDEIRENNERYLSFEEN